MSCVIIAADDGTELDELPGEKRLPTCRRLYADEV